MAEMTTARERKPRWERAPKRWWPKCPNPWRGRSARGRQLHGLACPRAGGDTRVLGARATVHDRRREPHRGLPARRRQTVPLHPRTAWLCGLRRAGLFPATEDPGPGSRLHCIEPARVVGPAAARTGLHVGPEACSWPRWMATRSCTSPGRPRASESCPSTFRWGPAFRRTARPWDAAVGPSAARSSSRPSWSEPSHACLPIARSAPGKSSNRS